jgi:hypothetical protein
MFFFLKRNNDHLEPLYFQQCPIADGGLASILKAICQITGATCGG